VKLLALIIVGAMMSLNAAEDHLNPVIERAILLGAKQVDKSSVVFDANVPVTDGMKSYVEKIEWPKDVKFRWKDKDSDIGLTLYSLDFTGPIELITEEHYGNKGLAGCVAIATTEHGQLVVPPKELKSADPVVWFLDNDDDDEYKTWAKRAMKLSDVLKGLEIQHEAGR
jgi:hypothetical protein